jgi:hypothetical protein
VVDFDPTLGQELLDVAIREPESQIPAHREDDDPHPEPEPDECRSRDGADRTRTPNHPATLTAHRADAPMQQSLRQGGECAGTSADVIFTAVVDQEQGRPTGS